VTPARALTEAQLRYLKRIADQMRNQWTGRIEIDLSQGGVGGFCEVRRLKSTDLEESDGNDYQRAS
jgi:hypothetical protein